jgi:DNA polymerase
MTTRTMTLASETDWPGYRQAARALLAALVPPEDVCWLTPMTAQSALFPKATDAKTPDPAAHHAMDFIVPPGFIALCQVIVLHADPERFALLYRLLWRLVHEPGLRHDPLDPDRVKAQDMVRAVRRDMHKMKAFVRFRPIPRPGEAPLHVAWFEPEHHIVEAVAPFFMRRFAQMQWAILTPERSVRWDGKALAYGAGAQRRDAPPPDAGEALWLTYYASIFNPSRLNLPAMRSEMPRKYWHNLPEAGLIRSLAEDALARSDRMIEAPPTMPQRRIVPLALVPEETSMTGFPKLPEDPTAALAVLKQATDRCRECPIGEHATQSVFGEGPVHAALMVVGEQPGDQEDLRGRPFVGPAGRLFDRAIAELGWPRERLYVTNAVKHFKFELRGKRRIHKTPSQREAAACLHWLESEIAQVQPHALIALGATAARALLGRPVSVMRERGLWHEGPAGLQVLVTLHPSALLRGEPSEREAAYRLWLNDLAMAADQMAGTAAH